MDCKCSTTKRYENIMERTTSKRYENRIPWVERSQPAVRRQRWRIQDDQKNAAMVADNLECKKTSQCASWKELNHHEQQIVEREAKTIENERIAGKKDMMVIRRQRLEKMLDEEEATYLKDLQDKGLAPYSERR